MYCGNSNCRDDLVFCALGGSLAGRGNFLIERSLWLVLGGTGSVEGGTRSV